MKKLFITEVLLCSAIIMIGAQTGFAWPTYEGGCMSCHGSGFSNPLHTIHTGQACTICHPGAAGAKPIPTSNCIVCHPAGVSPGLCPLIDVPAHAGIMTTCLGCHTTCAPGSPYCVLVNPPSAYQGQTLDLTIIGSNTNFIDTGSVDSTTVSFACTGITVNSTTVSSPTVVTANITIASDTPTGYCNVTVITGSEVITCGAFTITLPPPANDDVANSKVIGTLPFTDTINTNGATVAQDDLNLCYYPLNNTVWYVFSPSSDMRVTANTYGSDYETTLLWLRYRGYQCGYDCVSFDALAGEIYYFMVGSYDQGGGNLVFNVEEVTPFKIDLTLNETGVVDKAGVATISGVVTCSEPAEVEVDIQGRQRAGRLFITDAWYTYIYCDGATPWEIQLYGDIGPFLPGPVNVRSIAYGCSEGGGCGGYSNCVETPEVDKKVRLQPSKPTTTVPQSTTTIGPSDSDGDGIPDGIDNCPNICNRLQLDADGDGIGDVCDPKPGCGKGKQPACENPC